MPERRRKRPSWEQPFKLRPSRFAQFRAGVVRGAKVTGRGLSATAHAVQAGTQRVSAIEARLKELREKHFRNAIEREKAKQERLELQLELAKTKTSTQSLKDKLGKEKAKTAGLMSKLGKAKGGKLGQKLWTYLNTDYDNPKNQRKARKNLENS